MLTTILVCNFVRSVTTSCLQTLIPDGHIEVIIEPGKDFAYSHELETNYGNHSYTLYDSCVSGFVPPPTAYLIIVYNNSDFQVLIDRLSCNHHRWWPSVWSVVLLRNSTLGKNEEYLFVRRAITALWVKAVYNCAVLIEESESVYQADPLGPGNKCGRIAVDVHRSGCRHTPQPYRSVYPGCRILVSVRDSFPFSLSTDLGYEGTDVTLAEIIADKSNLTIEWTFRPNQYTASYNIAHAYYQNISRAELDLAIGGSVVSYTYFNNVTYAYSHITQYLYFYVANGVEIVGWKKLTAMFSIYIWLCILLTLLFSTCVLSLYGKRNTSQYFLIVLAILLQETVPVPSGKIRFVLMFIIFPFYYLSSMYTTTLHCYTMSPPLSREINTIDDLIKSNVTIIISDTNKFITDKVMSKTLSRALKQISPSPGLEEAANFLHHHRDIAIVERDMEMDGLMARKGYAFHHIDYKVATIRNALVYPKGSLYARRFHKLIMGSIESGLTNLWIKNALNKKQVVATPLNTRSIAWHDVQSAFALLVVGYAAATLAFIAEVYIHKYKAIIL